MEDWTASELALLCRSFAELSYLHEDLLLAMAEQVVSTLHYCTAQELCLLLDAYAAKRCFVECVVDAITEQSLFKLDEFTPAELCLHASSYTRLSLRNDELMEKISGRLLEVPIDTAQEMEPSFSARDICILAHAYCKREGRSEDIFNMLSRAAVPVMRDFTAKELQSLLARRCISQFSAESLALTLRGHQFGCRSHDPSALQALVELPRVMLTMRPADLATLCSSFAAAQALQRR
eukprot:Skav205116  [mRNA]  locus=scaffold1864:205872:211510:+ [translate_table: standard]